MKSISEYAVTAQNINEYHVYNDLIKDLQDTKETGMHIDEGKLTRLRVDANVFTVSQSVMKDVCNYIDMEKGYSLINLMNSNWLISKLCFYNLNIKIPCSILLNSTYKLNNVLL